MWWIRVNDNNNCVISEHNKQWNRGPFWLRRHTEALQRRSRFTTALVFNPLNNHAFSFEFHPIKTALRPQGTAPVLRAVPLQDLWWHVWRSSHLMKHGANTLAPQKKEIIIILLICSRYDERHKAEIGSDVAEVAPSQGLIHTLSTICSKMCICLSLPSCWCISVCYNHRFAYKEGILSFILSGVLTEKCWHVFKYQ